MSLNVGQMIERALRMHGELAGGASPAADVAGDMLIAANAMKRAWFGTLIGPRLSPIALAGTSGAAENGGEYQVRPTAAFALSAPGSPRSGNRFGVVDATLSFGTWACTVAGNGQLIGPALGTGSAAASQTLATSGQNARWWFRGDVGTWISEQDWAGLTSAIEFPDSIIAYMPWMLAVEIAGEFGQDITPEMAQGAMEGRMALARSYARRGPAGLDPVIGLSGPPQPAAAQR